MPQRIRDAFGIVLGVIQMVGAGGGEEGKINCPPVVLERKKKKKGTKLERVRKDS